MTGRAPDPTEHIVRLAWELSDECRDFTPGDERVLSALAHDAAEYWAERSGQGLPDSLKADDGTPRGVPRRVIERQRRGLDDMSDDAIGRYLPALAYAMNAPRQGDFLSSPSINRVGVIAATAHLPSGRSTLTVLDPAAGIGTTLLQGAEALGAAGLRVHALGQEINQATARIAAASLFLGRVDAHIQVGDSLTMDGFAGATVDIAISQPPFGLSWKGVEAEVRAKHHDDGWYPWGLPSRSDSAWLFTSRVLEKLRAPADGGGRAVVFCAPGALLGQANDAVRTKLLEADLLEVVVALPSGLSPSTGIPLYALVFANTRSPSRKGKVQVIDLRPYFQAATRRHSSQRALSEDAFDVLRDALATIRPGIASRTVPTEHFLRRKLKVTRKPTSSASLPAREWTWDVEIPASADRDQAMQDRYGDRSGLAWQEGESTQSRIEVDTLFDRTARDIDKWVSSLGWSISRLSAVLAASPQLAGTNDPGLEAQTVYLPMLTGTATVAQPPEGVSGRVLALSIEPASVGPAFVADWLNSPLGVVARRRAMDVARTGSFISAVRTEPRTLARFVDEIKLPLPPQPVEEDLVAAGARLDAVDRMVERARRDLWKAPAESRRVTGVFEPLFDTSLTRWCEELPYPIASALWTLESEKFNTHAAHRQVFLVWEAYAAFTGTVLLSALGQDPVLRAAESGPLSAAFSTAHLTMERATLGTWSVVIQRLSSCFRGLLDSEDPDDRSRVAQMFGGASPEALARVISPSVVRLLIDANAKRNSWQGHAGALPEEQLSEHLRYLTSRLEELRDEVGGAWRELQLVRAGDGSKHRGQLVQKVEVALGPNTPFRRTELTVGDLMESGELYLAAQGAAQPLRIEHFLVLRQSPASARYGCYFYNRLEGDNVRLVSYHLGEPSEVLERMDDVTDALRRLTGAVASDGEPDT